MRARLVWNSLDPAPYESAWSIFAKLLMLNYCGPRDIARIIRLDEGSGGQSIDLRDSSWIDFERFGGLLDMDSARLKAGFLDRLGFPIDRGGGGVRFCPECLALGYHCVLFDLPLLAICPLHNRALEPACSTCFSTVSTTGLVRAQRPYQLPSGIIHMSMWQGDVYSSRCGHIRFDPNDVTGVGRLSQPDRDRMRDACDAFVRWWRTICLSAAGHPELLRTLSRLTLKRDQEIAVGLCLDLARTIAGACPWTTSVEPDPADWLLCSFPAPSGRPEWNDRISLNSELGTVYRAVRRHLFARYIRPHRRCWREMAAYERGMSHVLSSRHVCTTVLAYMSWRMSIEGFSNIEAFRVHRPITTHLRSVAPGWSVMPSATEVGNTLYVHFFAILGQIERHMRYGSFTVERSEWGNYVHDFSHQVSERSSRQTASAFGTCYLVYPNKENLIRKSGARCFVRAKRPPTMLSVVANQKRLAWEWTGDNSEVAKAMLLFRVRDDRFSCGWNETYTHLVV